MSPAIVGLRTPLSIVLALAAGDLPLRIDRARWPTAGETLSGVIAGLPISYAKVGEPYNFYDPATGALIEAVAYVWPVDGVTYSGAVKGPIAGAELTAFLEDPTAAALVDLPDVALGDAPVPIADGTTLQGGVLAVNGTPVVAKSTVVAVEVPTAPAVLAPGSPPVARGPATVTSGAIASSLPPVAVDMAPLTSTLPPGTVVSQHEDGLLHVAPPEPLPPGGHVGFFQRAGEDLSAFAERVKAGFVALGHKLRF